MHRGATLAGDPLDGRVMHRRSIKSAAVREQGSAGAGLAMSNRVNANQLRRWVQLHGKRSAGLGMASRLLPVTVVAQDAPTRMAPSKGSSAEEIEWAPAPSSVFATACRHRRCASSAKSGCGRTRCAVEMLDRQINRHIAT